MTANPSQMMPSGAGGPEAKNHYVEAFDKKQNEFKQDGRHDQNRRDKVYEIMLENPDKASTIAQSYGVEFSPEMQELFKDPALAKLTLDGAKLAKNIGVSNPEAAKIFTQTYVTSNGNAAQAMDAIKDVRAGKFEPPNTSGLPKGMAWDEQSGRPVAIPGVSHGDYYKGEGGGNLPAGYRWGDNGEAEPIPGIDESYHRRGGAKPIKLWDNPHLAPELQLEGAALAKSEFPNIERIKDWTARAAADLQKKGVNPMDEALPTLPEVSGGGGSSPQNVNRPLNAAEVFDPDSIQPDAGLAPLPQAASSTAPKPQGGVQATTSTAPSPRAVPTKQNTAPVVKFDKSGSYTTESPNKDWSRFLYNK